MKSDAKSITSNRAALSRYRGDEAGKTEFLANESGRYGQDMLDETPMDELQRQHAMDSAESPLVGVTKNEDVAKIYAGENGQVYEINLPKGTATENIHNRNKIQGLDEEEWTVPLKIPSEYVKPK